MNYSISTLLVMEKSLRQRVTELISLKSEVSRRITWSDPNRVEEPLYDVKEVDKKVVEINKALFLISQMIKEANVITKINIDIDFDKLMEAIK